MKILLATSKASLTFGGIATYNYELQKILGRNHQLYLMTDSEEYDIPGYVQTISLNGKKKFSYKEARDIVERINSRHFDLIINSRSSLMPIIAPFVNAPIISVSHYVNGFQADNAGYNSKYQSNIVALSYWGKKYLDKKFSIDDPEKVKVIYNFVAENTKPFNEEKLNSNCPIIVFPGGTSRHKGFDMVMIAVYKLLKTNLPFKFYWLGNETLPVKELSLLRFHRISQFFKNDERVIITGQIPRDKAEELIGSANIFLLPSRGEGCPMSLLEAMREGCIPVISDAKHGSLELIEKLGCGEIVKNCSGTSLFYRLKHIIEDIDNYQDCYKKTYKFSRTVVSQVVWVQQMNSLILSCRRDRLVEPISEAKYNKSSKGYLKLYKRDRRKIQYEGFMIRIKLDYYYVLNKLRLLF